MKLLFDEDLSPRLCAALRALYPGSAHVRDPGLKPAPDADVWTRAVQDGFTIVTKDADFRQRSLLYGYPPKVIWVALRNCSTKSIASELRGRAGEVFEFLADKQRAFLVLSSGSV